MEHVYVHLFRGDQHSADHLALNPSGSVPVLTHLQHQDFPIGQSIAALEYLEELFPDQGPLLPPLYQPLERSKVRTLVGIICIDVQPVTNRRITTAVSDFGGDSQEWSKSFMTRGLLAYENVALTTAGAFSVGDSVSLADVCLVPAIWTAEKNDVDLGQLPTVMRIYNAMMELAAVQKAHWSRQEDTPNDHAWL